MKVVEDHSEAITATDLVYIGLSDAVAKETLTGATATTKTYAYDPLGRRATLSEDTHRYSYLNDPHGSVSMVIDQSRAVQAAYGYTGYGNANSSLTKLAGGFSVNTNVYRYTGKRWDTGSATYDMGARRYSAATGRFLQRDAYDDALSNLDLSQDPLTGNRYALAAGNPVNFVEVDGHKSAPVTTGAARVTINQLRANVRYLARLVYDVCILPMQKAGGYVREIWEGTRCRSVRRAYLSALRDLAQAEAGAARDELDACLKAAGWTALLVPRWYVSLAACAAGAMNEDKAGGLPEPPRRPKPKPKPKPRGVSSAVGGGGSPPPPPSLVGVEGGGRLIAGEFFWRGETVKPRRTRSA